MSALALGVVSTIPVGLAAGLTAGAIRVESNMSVTALGTVTAGSGSLYLLRYCPEANVWYRRGGEITADSASNGGQFENAFYCPYLSVGYYLLFAPLGITVHEAFLEIGD